MDMAKEDELRLKKQKKETISASINPSLIERLDAYCKEKGFYRANVVELAIEEYLDRKSKQKS